MALIVETGAGLSDADSYISEADATAYLTSIGKSDAWDAIDDKEAALRLATSYLLQRYRGRWLGNRRFITQALDWPRYGVVLEDSPGGFGGYEPLYDIDKVPPEVKQACALLALKTADGDLVSDIGRLTQSESVGSISGDLLAHPVGAPRNGPGGHHPLDVRPVGTRLSHTDNPASTQAA